MCPSIGHILPFVLQVSRYTERCVCIYVCVCMYVFGLMGKGRLLVLELRMDLGPAEEREYKNSSTSGLCWIVGGCVLTVLYRMFQPKQACWSLVGMPLVRRDHECC